MRIEIKRLQRRMDVSSIYVTHDQTEAMTLADRLAVINDGKIEQMGAPIELYNNPATLFVASFIGSPQINLLPCAFQDGHLRSGELVFNGITDLPESDKLVLGIRPDDLKIDTNGQLNMRVDIVEQHGADNLIYGEPLGALPTDGVATEICFKADQSMLPEIESSFALGFDPARALVFDAESGQRLR